MTLTSDRLEELETWRAKSWPVSAHGIATPLDVEEALCRVAADEAALAYRVQGLIAELITAAHEGAEAKADRDAALKECSKWAAEAGFAKGKLEASEWPGVVDDWRERAEKAESTLQSVQAQLEEARGVLVAIRQSLVEYGDGACGIHCESMRTGPEFESEIEMIARALSVQGEG